jgi:hypothetical protein
LKEYIDAGPVDLKSQIFDEIETFGHHDVLPEHGEMCVNLSCPRISKYPAQCILSKDAQQLDLAKCRNLWSNQARNSSILALGRFRG